MGRDRRLVPLRRRRDPRERAGQPPRVELLDGLPAGIRRTPTWQAAGRAAHRLAAGIAREISPTVRQSEAALVRWADSTRGVVGRLRGAVRQLTTGAQQRAEQRLDTLQARLEAAGDVMDRLRLRLEASRSAYSAAYSAMPSSPDTSATPSTTPTHSVRSETVNRGSSQQRASRAEAQQRTNRGGAQRRANRRGAQQRARSVIESLRERLGIAPEESDPSPE